MADSSENESEIEMGSDDSLQDIMLARIHAIDILNRNQLNVPGNFDIPASPATHHMISAETALHTAGSSRLELMPFYSHYANPAPQGQTCFCRIHRRKTANSLFYDLVLETDDTLLLSAKKKPTNKGAYYVIVPDQSSYSSRIAVAKLKSNFVGTEFVLTDQTKKRQYASIIYEPNVLGFKGPRKMTVALPPMTESGETSVVSSASKESLLYKYNEKSPKVVALSNKTPQWNDETNSFVLNFRGRVSVASVKNFQLVHGQDLEYIVMQFGKMNSDIFSMDFQYPLSVVQAFGIALSSFDAKLACE